MKQEEENMRSKIYQSLVMVVAVVALISGCASTGPKDSMSEKYPDWVLNPSMEGGLSAVGSAKMSKAGMSFTRTEAIADARDGLARQMSVKVKNMIKRFTEATGVGDDETVDRVSTQVSKQLSSQTLAGSKAIKMEIIGDELFVLVVLDPAAAMEAANAVREAVNTSYKNEKALWQKFQAKKAQEELNAEIDKEFGDFKGN